MTLRIVSERLPTISSTEGKIYVTDYIDVKEKDSDAGFYQSEIKTAEVIEKSTGSVTLIEKTREKTAKIEWIEVSPKRKVFGRAVVEAVENDLRERGYKLVKVEAVRAVVPFWEKLGYVPQEEGVPGQALEMAKVLQNT